MLECFKTQLPAIFENDFDSLLQRKEKIMTRAKFACKNEVASIEAINYILSCSPVCKPIFVHI